MRRLLLCLSLAVASPLALAENTPGPAEFLQLMDAKCRTDFPLAAVTSAVNIELDPDQICNCVDTGIARQPAAIASLKDMLTSRSNDGFEQSTFMRQYLAVALSCVSSELNREVGIDFQGGASKD